MADTAPVYASAFFSNPGAVYGLAAVGRLVTGASGGGLTTLTPVGKSIVCYSGDATPVLACSQSPEVGGTLTAQKLIATSGGIDCGGKLTVSTGGLAVSAGGIEVAGAYDITLARPPQDALHAATKAYVDSVASGLHIKPAVRFRTVGALPTYTSSSDHTVLTGVDNGSFGEGVFDGAPDEDDRVLVADEGEGGANNGIFVVTSLGSPPEEGVDGTPWVLTRPADANSSETLPGGAFVFVTEGGTYGDRGFVLTADNVSLGTTPLVFTQFTSTSTPPGGNAGQVQFNNSGGFGGSASLNFNAGTLTVGVTGEQAGSILVKAGADGAGGGITVAGTLDATTVLVGGGGFISTGGISVNEGAAAFAGLASFNGTAATFSAETAATFEGPATFNGTVSVQGPTDSGHAATRQYVDDAVAEIPSTVPGGSDGQFQYKSGSAFAGSAALTHGEGEVAVRGAAFSVYGTGEVPSQILSVGGTGVVISGGAEHTLSAGTGSIDDSPGIVINSGSIAIYGDGIGSGKSNLTADADGVSITRAYEISSGSGKPIRLKGDPTTSGDLPGATGYVAVGAISGQDGDDQAGAAVAFGTGAGVTAPRGIALGMGAVARVADAAVIPALSLSQNVAGATAAVSRSGLAAYAAGMTFLPSAPLNLKTAFINTVETPSSYSSFEVPAGAMFIPLGAVVWLHAINASGDIAVAPTLEVTRASASGGVILPATALTIASNSPVGLAVGATPSDFTAVSATGVIFYRVVVAAAAGVGGSITSASARVALYGLCVELET